MRPSDLRISSICSSMFMVRSVMATKRHKKHKTCALLWLVPLQRHVSYGIREVRVAGCTANRTCLERVGRTGSEAVHKHLAAIAVGSYQFPVADGCAVGNHRDVQLKRLGFRHRVHRDQELRRMTVFHSCNDGLGQRPFDTYRRSRLETTGCQDRHVLVTGALDIQPKLSQ